MEINLKNPFKKKEKKETLSVQDKLDDLLNNYGQASMGFKMAKDIFSELNLTIHEEKARCKKAYRENSYLQTAVNNLVNVIMGDCPEIFSENQIIYRYAKKWQRFSKHKKAIREGINEAVTTGDGYVKKIKGNLGNFKYQHIENSEDMYIDYDWEKEQPKRYIRRYYYTQAQAKKIGLKAFTLKTSEGVRTIFGVEYSPDEIIHFKFGNHYERQYGRSPIASVLNDVSIMNRIERSIAVIAMFKAVPQKILTPKQTSNEINNWTSQQIKLIEGQLKSQKDYESSIVGTPMDSLNVTDSGQLIDLNGYLDYFKRKISICLSPEFIVHGELVNRNTSSEQKQFFYLSVVSLREEFIDEIEESLEGLSKSLQTLRDKGINVPNATFEFVWGDYDVELREEKNQRILSEITNGLITLNEYREQMGYEPDEEIGNHYLWELRPTQPAQQIEQIKQVIDDGKENQKDNK
jgi:hypothetical protein